ncbi:MAG: glycerol-3-phosphate dehydrogenase [SAR324 cluster bacterium]|nr:glycerol-3-phosphate dehydrogenase [SAR324 cluster bacterium]
MNGVESVDLVIIGGGINGVGIARDAAGRGLAVLLCEQEDLASGTSSASSKLIHGGLRYLELYEFRLVREALAEREVLLRIAPHIVWPLRFVLPHDKALRPAWMIRMGLFLYDHLSGRHTLPSSRGVRLRRHPAGEPLQQRLDKAFVYSDCWVDDSRLVVVNAMDAARRGATILTRTRCVAAKREAGGWLVTLRSGDGGKTRTVKSRGLVNAAGPWVGGVMADVLGVAGYRHLSLIKGSHVVVPRLYEGEQAYVLQNVDGRVIFVIPFLDRFSLIGTTDVPFAGDPGEVRIDAGEVNYLCAAVNRYLARPVSPSDVVWSYAGVRPLYNDAQENPSAISREYVLELDEGGADAPLLSVIGGKITAYRQVAEHAMEKLAPFYPGLDRPWTASAPLPGGDMPRAGFDPLLSRLKERYPWLPDGLRRRLARAYGSLTETLLADATSPEQLGRHFGGGLYEREVRWMLEREWAQTADDVLWRRSKLGLYLSPQERDGLAAWLEAGGSGSAREQA